MLFSSATFLIIFLPLLVAVHWAVPTRARVPLLLVASYVFYLSWNPIYGLLLAGSTVGNFALAKLLERTNRSRGVLAVAVAFNLVVLAFFKYAGLLSRSAAQLLAWLGLASAGRFDGLHVLLPLAISFFTFEMISMQVDIYRGDARMGSFLVFATYKAFFPKLISGPITRYRQLAPQLERPAPLQLARLQSGVALFTLGLVKKLVLADNLSTLADALFRHPQGQGAGLALVGILGFGFQIYFDFSAYTDMARGVSRVLGLELPINFRFPYAATSPSDFWARWHISLSTWLRDYLYIPLGGNRHGRPATYRNLMITMALGGLWHGAAWHFMLWGAIHGVFLCVSHALRGRVRGTWVTRAAGWASTMVVVFGAWVFFRAATVGQALDVFRDLARPLDLAAPTALFSSPSAGKALAGLLALLIASAGAARLARPVGALWRRPVIRPAALAVGSLACWTIADVLSRSTTVPFIYFHF
ncbi:MAG: MBOAT family protein [Solirubrobacterales bacterium]|nr:MBOAT family protein [Solirubrobacterales bacterium]